MESASDGQVAFPTHLNLSARSGTKTMVVKIDPGAQVNTILLSRYHTLYPNKLNKSRYPKAQSLMTTHHTWISHNGSPKLFLDYFIVDVVHAKEPRLYSIRIYVFEDVINPHILLFYATSERLGIVSFQVPNVAATHSFDQVVIHNPSQWQEEDCKESDLSGPYQYNRGVPNMQQCPSKPPWQEEDHFPPGLRCIASTHCKTINNNQEVKVGSSILSSTLPLAQGT